MTDEGTDDVDDGLRTRRQVLRATAATTASAATVDTAGASTSNETPATGTGTTRRRDATERDSGFDPASTTRRTNQERRVQWTARHRNHYRRNQTGHDMAAPLIWQGISDTTIRLVDVAYQPFGNPVDDADDPGCWRYTFSVGSVAMGVVPYPDAVEYDDDNRGTVTEDKWMLAHPDLPLEYGHTDRIEDTIRVMGPEPNDDVGVNPKLDAVAIAARRSPELFSVINGSAVVDSLVDEHGGDEAWFENLGEKFGDMAVSQGETVGSSSDTVENYALRAHHASAASKDLKTTFDLGRGFLGLLADEMNWTTLADDILGPVGAFFDMKKLGESIYELAFRDAADRAANWQGFEVSEETRATGPISGHQYVFDVYVAPDRRTFVTVESEHALQGQYPTTDSGYIETLGNPTWTIEFDAPPEPEAEPSLTEAEKFTSATVDQLDAPNRAPQHAWPAMNVQNSAGGPTIDEWPADEELTIDAYDTAISDGPLLGHAWTVEMCTAPPTTGCSVDEGWVTEHETGGRLLEYTPETYGTYRVTLTVTEYSGSVYNPVGEETSTTMTFEVYPA